MKYIEKDNYLFFENGDIYSKASEEFLKASLHKPTGYMRVNIWGKPRYVHRLIAEAWLKKPSEEHNEISHIDNNKQNNNINNLEWVTHGENIRKYWAERRAGLYDNYEATPEMKAYQKKRRSNEKYNAYHRAYYQKHKHEINLRAIRKRDDARLKKEGK